MDIVMFHSGKEFPEFLEYTFRQIRLFNPDITVYFLTDETHTTNLIFTKYRIIAIDKDLFYSDKINEFELAYNRKSDNFWTITATRLIYIENFLREFKLKNVYHFENDVLLYYDLNQHHRAFQNTYKYLAITTGGEDKAMTGFLFIKNWRALASMTQFFIDVLQTNGVKGVKNMYQMDMVNEMTLMRAYGKEKGEKYLDNLPILPFGDFSENFEVFNSIFDPASWGQFVGGEVKYKTPGCKPTDHYIGQELLQHPEYDVVWKKDNKGRNIPYFKYDDTEVKINNFHIHSKNLHKYIS